MTRTVPALVVLAALAALDPYAARAGGRGHERERPPTCDVVEIASDQTPRAVHRFRATRVVELEFEVELLRPRKVEAPPRLRLYTPDGFLYQVLDTQEVRGRAARRYRARLPVAGSSIMQSGLYGRWRVVPHAGDAREACGHAQSFFIRP